MPIIFVETTVPNAPHGVDYACQCTDLASELSNVIEGIELTLEENLENPLTDEEKAQLKVLSCEFVESDSNRMHGTCYFECRVEVPESLAARIGE